MLSLALAAAILPTQGVLGYVPVVPVGRRPVAHRNVQALYSSTETRNDADFAAFADSLEQEDTTTTQRRSTKDGPTSDQTWQACVEELLDPTTPLNRRQASLAKLVNANKDIQESVLTALRDRKIDGLLTPTGKKLQDGTQTVARQITNDILPNLARTAAPPNPGSLLPDPEDVTKVGSRILNALGSQVQRNLEVLQGDLANPVRIPQRISRQTEDFVTEARNVFSETPVGLDEPPYTVGAETESYEIRDYEGYSVASTSMGKGVVLETSENSVPATNLAETGAAFNSLAAYLFGANKQGESMEMTTPVTTTSWGEMRFYLSPASAQQDIPDPLDDVSSGSLYETGSVTILDIPPARLAVKKFTGFVTEGEITRQKDALLSALSMDDVELDVAHGDPISHVIFQYNPPYTLPIVRRNEIAVAVRRQEDDVVDLKQEWGDNKETLADLESVNGASYNSAPVTTAATDDTAKEGVSPSDPA